MEYLIKKGAFKKCQCCKTNKYSIEFADADFIARAGDWYKITSVCIDCRSQRFKGN